MMSILRMDNDIKHNKLKNERLISITVELSRIKDRRIGHYGKNLVC
jgi:hypothetical protein